jgi:3-oxoadipate enol-lactonase
VRAILDMPDDVRLELCNVRVPTLVVVGTQDILTPLADSEELCELLPRAELVILSGAAHGLMFDRAGDFNAAVQTFLDSVDAPEPEALPG